MAPLHLRLLPAATLALAALCSTAAQTQAPVQTQPLPATLRANARLVVIDVVVTDTHQSPVHNLKQADFALLEDNAPQALKSFEEHTALSPTEAARFQRPPKLPPGIFTNQAPTPVNSAVNILLLDTLNTPLNSQAFVRSQLLAYLKSARPGASVAIFGLSTRLLMLQGFTSDPEILKAAITRKPGKASPLLDDAVGGDGGQEALSDQLSDSGLGTKELIANLQDFEAEQKSLQLQLRAKYTLDALNTLARYLAGIPGRKNLIWFSGSFPVSILPDPDTTGNPFAGVASSEAEFRETTSLLSRAQVAVYPVDARGLTNSPAFDAANSGSLYARGPQNFVRDQRRFANDTAAEHSTMLQMAADTGGKAFVNTNGLNQAVASAIDLGSNYYTLTYTPANTNWNGDQRKVLVKLEAQHPGYTLAYRHAYYASDPYAVHATAAPPPDSTRAALTHGAPPATQIVFEARVLPTSTTDEEKLTPANVLPNASDKRSRGPYRSYIVTYAADPHHLSFEKTPDDTAHAALEFLTLLYADDGTLINSQTNGIDIAFNPAQFAGVMRSGLSFRQQISVPVKGEFSLRLAIHDRRGNAIGATEIPMAAVKNLPPPTPPK